MEKRIIIRHQRYLYCFLRLWPSAALVRSCCSCPTRTASKVLCFACRCRLVSPPSSTVASRSMRRISLPITRAQSLVSPKRCQMWKWTFWALCMTQASFLRIDISMLTTYPSVFRSDEHCRRHPGIHRRLHRRLHSRGNEELVHCLQPDVRDVFFWVDHLPHVRHWEETYLSALKLLRGCRIFLFQQRHTHKQWHLIRLEEAYFSSILCKPMICKVIF